MSMNPFIEIRWRALLHRASADEKRHANALMHGSTTPFTFVMATIHADPSRREWAQRVVRFIRGLEH